MHRHGTGPSHHQPGLASGRATCGQRDLRTRPADLAIRATRAHSRSGDRGNAAPRSRVNVEGAGTLGASRARIEFNLRFYRGFARQQSPLR